MNPLNSPCTDETRDQKGPCLHDLKDAYSPSQDITKPQPDLRIYWIWGFYFYEPRTLFRKNTYNKFLRELFLHYSHYCQINSKLVLYNICHV